MVIFDMGPFGVSFTPNSRATSGRGTAWRWGHVEEEGALFRASSQ